MRLMPMDGSAPPKVIAYVYGGQGTINVPSWSPDGTHIAFVSQLRRPVNAPAIQPRPRFLGNGTDPITGEPPVEAERHGVGNPRDRQRTLVHAPRIENRDAATPAFEVEQRAD